MNFGIPIAVYVSLLNSCRDACHRGLLDNIYVDNDLRLARGNKGTIFVLRRDDGTVLPSGE